MSPGQVKEWGVISFAQLFYPNIYHLEKFKIDQGWLHRSVSVVVVIATAGLDRTASNVLLVLSGQL